MGHPTVKTVKYIQQVLSTVPKPGKKRKTAVKIALPAKREEGIKWERYFFISD